MTMSNRTVHTQLGKPLTSLTLYAMVMQLSGRVVHYRFLALYAKAAAAITLGVPGSDDLALQFGQFLATQYWNLVGGTTLMDNVTADVNNLQVRGVAAAVLA